MSGQFCSLLLGNASLQGAVGVVLSFSGGGPNSSEYGTVFLSPPFEVLPLFLADSSGFFSISSGIPSVLSGIPVWVQALDLGKFQLSNGLALVIQ